MHNLRILFWILGLTKQHFESLKGKDVNKNSWKEAVWTETDGLIRTAVLWPGWNVVGPEANYLISA